ncbi:probable RNA-dependent RNA polymerase 5 isoform X2 [Cryptomeria japonica]|uniref:probable RNA-dependent RNA polymerase 5 isoform X2 n=1 Tax=Cryptomeria japonica TaxID=3369 RepID=UPI0025AD1BFD|nr:probable RNA-dependent RNA polymerase 5 isoform X2 [Cryptomeria japonica]
MLFSISCPCEHIGNFIFFSFYFNKMWRKIKSMIFQKMAHESNPGSSSESPSSISLGRTDSYDESHPINGKRKQALTDEDVKKRKRETPSFTEHCKALGKLDFPKVFLVLNYVAPYVLEEVLSIQDIKNLYGLEITDIETNIRQALARTVGRTCFSEEKRYEWNPLKRHEYHCYVDLVGNCILKGPFPVETTTHLHRVLGDSNVLQLHFEGRLLSEQLEENGRVKDELYKRNGQPKMFRDWAKEGIFVGLRRYQFFVFKDSGKQKNKNSLSSSVKCYFVCTQSFAEEDRNSSYILFEKSIHEARCMFMHAHTVPNFKRYMARFSLILSKTICFEGDISSPEIVHIKDVPCMDENQNEAKDINGEALIHTDGTGFISEDLASQCKIYQGKHFDKDSKACPLLIQCRLFYDGYAVKGTLLVNRELPHNTIHIRESMIKVEKDGLLSCEIKKSLEICQTSYKPRRSSLSRYLIALLSYGGVPDEIFFRLVHEAFDQIQNNLRDRSKAFKVIKERGYLDEDYTVLRMLSCGIPLDEPFLQYKLKQYMLGEIKTFKGGKVPVEDSFYLMGTADPTGQLKRNEVCVILDHGQVSGKVLVYRNPGLHFGDIHVLKAVYVEDIEKVVGDAKYGIFFSTQGPRSLADEIATGDFDGDLYWVSMNAEFLQHFKPEKAWERPSEDKGMSQPRPTDFSHEELEEKLIEEFFNQRFAPSNAISVAADSWLVFMDRLLTPRVKDSHERQTLKEKMLRLTSLYYEALDAPKTGRMVNVPKELIPEKRPHFLKKDNHDDNGNWYYNSSSVLGRINDLKISEIHSRSDEIWTIPCFQNTNTGKFKAKWKKHYDHYRSEMTKALNSDDQLKCKSNANANAVTQNYKQILYGAMSLKDSPISRQQIHLEASTIYQIVYEHAQERNEIQKCCFAWKVAGEALCELYLENEKQEPILISPFILYGNIS